MLVNRGKPYVCHFVQLIQFFQHHIPDYRGRNFAGSFTFCHGFVFDFVYKFLDGPSGNRPFFQGPGYPPFNLCPVKGFPPLVFFYDEEGFFFYTLIRSKSVTAFQRDSITLSLLLSHLGHFMVTFSPLNIAYFRRFVHNIQCLKNVFNCFFT